MGPLAAGVQGCVEGKRESGSQILSRKGGSRPGGSGEGECGLDHQVRRFWWLSGPSAPQRQLLEALACKFALEKLTGAQSPAATPSNASLFLKLKFS